MNIRSIAANMVGLIAISMIPALGSCTYLESLYYNGPVTVNFTPQPCFGPVDPSMTVDIPNSSECPPSAGNDYNGDHLIFYHPNGTTAKYHYYQLDLYSDRSICCLVFNYCDKCTNQKQNESYYTVCNYDGTYSIDSTACVWPSGGGGNGPV